MGICGYNDKIGGGIQLLVEGMIDALEKKAAASTTDEVLALELVELEAMISVLGATEGETLPTMFAGLDILAKALFSAVRAELLSSRNRSLAVACRRIGGEFVDLLAETEAKSQQMKKSQEAQASPADLAEALAEWALSRSRGALRETAEVAADRSVAR
jgi:hypothetical protein